MTRPSGDDLAIVIPLWRRTTHIDRVHASAKRATPEALVVFVVNRDDEPVVDALARTDYLTLAVDWPGGSRGDYARKINAGYRETIRPFIFTGADDIDFHPEWYEAAFRAGNDHTGQIGVVGTVDLCNQRTMDGEHSTHSLVARWYADLGACVDQDHVIYHEGYPHDYVDDELVETARARGAYAHSYLSIVEHLHPNAGKADVDDTYRHARANVRIGRTLYRRRRRLWGGR